MWIYLLLLTIAGHSCSFGPGQPTRVCTPQNAHNNAEIKCSEIPSTMELEESHTAITHQNIVCSNPNITTQLTSTQTAALTKLVFFHLENCLVLALPENYFQHLVKLQSVTLDNLPLIIIEPNVFDNSSNLLDLTLSRLRKLQAIHPRFLGHQKKLETLSLIESNINEEQLRHVLLPCYITLRNLYWRRNVNKLSFSQEYFHNFHFDILVLEYNRISSADFMKYVSAKHVSLKGNPIGELRAFNLDNYPTLADRLTILDLTDTRIDRIFGDTRNVTFPHLTELILSDNVIREIPDTLETIFPSLRILDLRNNRLTTLGSLEHMLRIRSGRVYVAGNYFHCNCHMKWAEEFDKKQIQNLYCQLAGDDNSTISSLVTLRNVQTICRAPTVQLAMNDAFQIANYTAQPGDNDTEKVYRIDIYPGEIFNWRCIGQGDPAPRLKWLKDRLTVKHVTPALDKHQLQTVMSNLIISHKNSKNSDKNDYSIYTCSATNIAGSAELQLHITRRTERIPVDERVLPGNLYQEKKGGVGKIPDLNLLLSAVVVLFYYRFYWK